MNAVPPGVCCYVTMFRGKKRRKAKRREGRGKVGQFLGVKLRLVLFFKDPYVLKTRNPPPQVQMWLQAHCIRRPQVLWALPTWHGPTLDHVLSYLIPLVASFKPFGLTLFGSVCLGSHSTSAGTLSFTFPFAPIKPDSCKARQTTSLVNKSLKYHRDKSKTYALTQMFPGLLTLQVKSIFPNPLSGIYCPLKYKSLIKEISLVQSPESLPNNMLVQAGFYLGGA